MQDNKELLQILKSLLEDKKAEDIVVLDVSKHTNIANYFVIATANSPVHAKALLKYLLEELEKEKHKTRPCGRCRGRSLDSH